MTDVQRTDDCGVLVAYQGTSSQPFGFAGEQLDNETSSMPMGARAYDPKLGRFMQRDAMVGSRAAPSSLHRFSYSLNNPVRFVDPSRCDSEDAADQDLSMEITSTCSDSSDNSAGESMPDITTFMDAAFGSVDAAFDQGAKDAVEITSEWDDGTGLGGAGSLVDLSRGLRENASLLLAETTPEPSIVDGPKTRGAVEIALGAGAIITGIQSIESAVKEDQPFYAAGGAIQVGGGIISIGVGAYSWSTDP